MVPVAFGTAYLFLALFALPHVLAAPAAAALGPRSSIKDEALSLHNNWRVNHGRDNLTWSGHLETLAMLHGVFCKYDPAAPLGMPSKGLSLFTEDTHVRTYREPGIHKLRHRCVQFLDIG